MLCVLILYINDGTYSLKLSPNEEFLNLFLANFLLLSEICWEEVAKEILFLNSSSWRFLTWVLNSGLWSNKPTHYLLGKGDDLFYHELNIWTKKSIKAAIEYSQYTPFHFSAFLFTLIAYRILFAEEIRLPLSLLRHYWLASVYYRK